MNVFRLTLAAIAVIILGYTLALIPAHGVQFLPIFVRDILAVNWNGQFNLDFAGYLLVSAIWVAWRGGFSAASIALGLVASVAGMLFFAPYVLWLSLTSGREPRTLLLGVHADRG